MKPLKKQQKIKVGEEVLCTSTLTTYTVMRKAKVIEIVNPRGHLYATLYKVKFPPTDMLQSITAEYPASKLWTKKDLKNREKYMSDLLILQKSDNKLIAKLARQEYDKVKIFWMQNMPIQIYTEGTYPRDMDKRFG